MKTPKFKHKLDAFIKSLSNKADSRFKNQDKLKILIIGSVMIAIMLTVFSIILYSVTGSSKLDLSRPGYEAARKKVNNSKSVDDYSFPANGKLDKKTIEDFLYHYNERLKTTHAYDKYDSKIIDDATLGLTEQ